MKLKYEIKKPEYEEYPIKTLGWWLCRIKNPGIKRSAITNASQDLSEKYPSFKTALTNAFLWEETSQGRNYWKEIAYNSDNYII